MWSPLPFPTCPNCHNSWVKSYHLDCYANGELLVELYLRQTKCEGCGQRWSSLPTTFHCSCGHVFHSSEIENAISTTISVRERLLKQIQSMEQSETSIHQTAHSSLAQWLNGASFELGKLFGIAAVTIKHWLEGLL